jgi:hypothetical protein
MEKFQLNAIGWGTKAIWRPKVPFPFVPLQIQLANRAF